MAVNCSFFPLPLECSVAVVAELPAKDTSALACCSKPAPALINFVATCGQRNFNLQGIEKPVVFDKEDQTITVLRLQKEKIRIIIDNPDRYFGFLNKARTSVQHGYFQESPRGMDDQLHWMDVADSELVTGDPDDSQALCQYANLRSNSIMLSLVLFDFPSKTIKDYEISEMVGAALNYQDKLPLIKIIFHHSNDRISGMDLGSSIVKMIKAKQMDLARIFLSHEKVDELSGYWYALILKALIETKNLALFYKLYSQPKAKEMDGSCVELVLVAAIQAKNLKLVQTFISDPTVTVVCENLLQAAVASNDPDIFALLFAKAKEIDGRAIARCLTPALQNDNYDFFEALLSLPSASKIPAGVLPHVAATAIAENQLTLCRKLLFLPIEDKLNTSHLLTILNCAKQKSRPKFIELALSHPSAEELKESELLPFLDFSIDVDNPALLKILLSLPSAKNISAKKFSFDLLQAFYAFLFPAADEKDKSHELEQLLLTHPTVIAILGEEVLNEITEAIEGNHPEALKAILSRLDPTLFTNADSDQDDEDDVE